MPESTNKRLEQLRRQVYGSLNKHTNTVDSTDTTSSRDTDVKYLRQDLVKIAILSILVLGIQIALYYAFSKNLINIL